MSYNMPSYSTITLQNVRDEEGGHLMTSQGLRKSAFPIALFSVFAISSVAGVMGKFPFQKKQGIPIKAR